MPRKKTKSDELYNIRRRLERQSFAEMKRGNEARARELYAEAQLFRGVNSDKAKELLIKAAKSKQSAVSKSARASAMFRQQINTAGSGASQYSDARRKAFFASTRQIWQGREGDRLQAIQQYFYRSNTTESQEFKAWAKEQGYDLRSPNMFAIEQYIADANAEYMEPDATEKDGSPSWMKLLVTFG